MGVSICVPLVFVPHVSQSDQPSAGILVLTVIVVQRCHAACTEARYSSTRHRHICVIDEHPVKMYHIIREAYVDDSSDLWVFLSVYVASQLLEQTHGASVFTHVSDASLKSTSFVFSDQNQRER